jgi:outer membrane protein OmpA-like peptidoglycan-associated protein
LIEKREDMKHLYKTSASILFAFSVLASAQSAPISSQSSTAGSTGATTQSQSSPVIQRIERQTQVSENQNVAAAQSVAAPQPAAFSLSIPSRVETVVSNIDQYKASNQTEIHFRPGQTVLSKNAKDALDQMAGNLKGQRGYIIEVQGFSSSKGQAAITTSQKIAESVVRYLVLAHQIPVYRIYLAGMGNAPVADDATTKRVSGGRVEVSLLKNDLEYLTSTALSPIASSIVVGEPIVVPEENVVAAVQRETQVRASKPLGRASGEAVVLGIVRLTGNRKPTAPVTIDGLEPGPMVAPGKQVVVVTLTPLVDGPIELHATGTDGVEVEDQGAWRFDGQKGVPVSHSITLSSVAPIIGARRLFLSVVVDPESTAQTGIASFLLNPTGVHSKSTADLGKTEIGGRGQPVVEQKAQ